MALSALVREWRLDTKNVCHHTMIQNLLIDYKEYSSPTARVDLHTGLWDARGVPIFAKDLVFDNKTLTQYCVHLSDGLWYLIQQADAQAVPLSQFQATELQVIGYMDPRPHSTRQVFHNPEARTWYDFLDAAHYLRKPTTSKSRLSYKCGKLWVEVHKEKEDDIELKAS